MLPQADQIDLEMRKYVAQEAYDEWLVTPNVELNFKTPQELLLKRDYQPLWGMIDRMRAAIA